MSEALPAYSERVDKQAGLLGLPAHVLVRMISMCSLDLFVSLLGTCKTIRSLSAFYLRRLLLQMYLAKIRANSSSGITPGALDSDGDHCRRELKVLDLFCLACAVEAKRQHESELFSDTSDAQGVERDLFDRQQVRIATRRLLPIQHY